MGMIIVKVFATYRRILNNQKEIQLDVPTPMSTRRALDTIFTDYPALQPEILDDEGQVLPHVSVFVSGRDIRHKQGLDTPLQEGEVLSLFPPVAGG